MYMSTNSLTQTLYLESIHLLEENGDMLVIAADQHMSEIQPFVDWKIQSGIKTTLVSTNDAGSTDTTNQIVHQQLLQQQPKPCFCIVGRRSRTSACAHIRFIRMGTTVE